MFESMGTDPILFGRLVQSFPVGSDRYRIRMEKRQLQAILWANIQVLMKRDFGGENLTRLAREAGMSPASSTRLKTMSTGTGSDIVAKIATVFGVEPWQLLVPRLGADLYKLDGERRFVPVYVDALPTTDQTQDDATSNILPLDQRKGRVARPVTTPLADLGKQATTRKERHVVPARKGPRKS